MSFSMSASSESESDDNDEWPYRVRDTEFIRQFKLGRYNVQCVYPNKLHYNCHCTEHANQSMAMHASGVGNSSMGDVSHRQMNGSRVLDSSAILNTTQNRDQSNLNIKIRPPPQNQQQATKVLIPLDRIDFITLPTDPRKSETYCNINEDEHSFPWTLLLPRFWRGVSRQIGQNLNQERTMQRKLNLPTSYMTEQVSKILFEQPPRKIQSSSKSQNQPVPNPESSVFDVPNPKEDESFDSSSLSSTYEPTNKYSRHNGSAFLSDTSDDDEEDLSHVAMNKGWKTGDISTNYVNGKISPFKNDPKESPANKSSTLNGEENLLLENPPFINKDEILDSLTDSDESDHKDWIPIIPNAMSPKINGEEKPINVSLETNPEAINMLESLIHNVADNIEIDGDDKCKSLISAIPTSVQLNVTESDKSDANENCIPVVPIEIDPISNSLTDKKIVVVEKDGDENCAPNTTNPNVDNMEMETLTDYEQYIPEVYIRLGSLIDNVIDNAKIDGDKKYTPIATIPAGAQLNDTELLTDKKSDAIENCTEVVSMAPVPISSSLTVKESVVMERDGIESSSQSSYENNYSECLFLQKLGDGNGAPNRTNAANPKVDKTKTLTDHKQHNAKENCTSIAAIATGLEIIGAELLNDIKNDGVGIHGDENRIPNVPIATTSKANGGKNSHTGVKRTIVEKKIPTKNSKTKPTKTNRIEARKVTDTKGKKIDAKKTRPALKPLENLPKMYLMDLALDIKVEKDLVEAKQCTHKVNRDVEVGQDDFINPSQLPFNPNVFNNNCDDEVILISDDDE